MCDSNEVMFSSKVALASSFLGFPEEPKGEKNVITNSKNRFKITLDDLYLLVYNFNQSYRYETQIIENHAFLTPKVLGCFAPKSFSFHAHQVKGLKF